MNKVNRKSDLAIKDLLARENYLVVQANDLAKAFGGLTAFQHKILDYTVSFIQAESKIDEMFTANILDIIHQFGINASGKNYRRVADAFKALNEKTALYFEIKRNDGRIGVRMTQLFDYIDLFEDGKVQFQFSKNAEPYLFELRKNFYSFKLSEIAQIKSKYSLIMMKLWEANRFGNSNQDVTISGTLDEWEGWFLGNETRWPVGRFSSKVLDVAIEEIGNKLHVWFEVKKHKRGRKIVGYDITIHSSKSNLF